MGQLTFRMSLEVKVAETEKARDRIPFASTNSVFPPGEKLEKLAAGLLGVLSGMAEASWKKYRQRCARNESEFLEQPLPWNWWD